MKNQKELKEALDMGYKNCSKVIILTHINPDFDAIASSLALAVIAKKYNKEAYIIIDDPIYKLFHGIQTIINEAKQHYNIITSEEYDKIKDENDLFVLTDVNGLNRIPLKDFNENNSIIIDHHDTNTDTINAYFTYIDTNASSASEIITLLFKNKIDSQIATYLLSGIYLDTERFQNNFGKDTKRAFNKLLSSNAQMNMVTEWFLEDYYSIQKMKELRKKVKYLTYVIAYVEGEDSLIYTREELAKVAVSLLDTPVNNISPNASFAIGKIDDEIIGISARSKEEIDVGEIMRLLSGGGNAHSAATQLENTTIDSAKTKLLTLVKPKNLK